MAAKKTKKKKLIVGNWKMNPTSATEARRIFNAIKARTRTLSSIITVICPPFVFAGIIKPSSKIEVGTQDIYFEERGSYTGEVSVPMITSLGLSYVIIGHSERRKMGETDEVVARKAKTALDGGLKTIVCVGENTRDPQGDYLEFLKNQIKNSLIKVQKKDVADLIIAYEPVWAIGATEAMTPRDIHETSIYIKKIIADMFNAEEAFKVPILYGGAVNFRNARDIITLGEVDGLLIGRESLNPPGFIEILKTIDLI